MKKKINYQDYADEKSRCSMEYKKEYGDEEYQKVKKYAQDKLNSAKSPMYWEKPDPLTEKKLEAFENPNPLNKTIIASNNLSMLKTIPEYLDKQNGESVIRQANTPQTGANAQISDKPGNPDDKGNANNEKAFFDMTQEEKNALAQKLTGYDMDKALQESARMQNQGKVDESWKLFGDITKGKIKYDPGLFDNMQTKIENDNKGQKEYIRSSDTLPTDKIEEERIIKREELVNKIKELTGGMDFDLAVETLGVLKKNNQVNQIEGVPIGLPENLKQVDELLNNAPPELFIPTKKEYEENLKSGDHAIGAGLRKAASLGLDGLDKGGEVYPEEMEKIKELVLSGQWLGGSAYPENGKFFRKPFGEEDEIMQKSSPFAFAVGEIVGSLLPTKALGFLGEGVSAAIGAGKTTAKAISSTLSTGVDEISNAITYKKDPQDAARDIVSNSALSGVTEALIPSALKKVLKNAPDALVNNAGKAGKNISYQAMKLLFDYLKGKNISITDYLKDGGKSLTQDILSGN